MAENLETHLPRDNCTEQEMQPTFLGRCSFLGRLQSPRGGRQCWQSALELGSCRPKKLISCSAVIPLCFGLCMPIQEEHLLINYIPCLGEVCKSEAVLGSEEHWQQQGHAVSPRLSAESVPCPDPRPCSAHPPLQLNTLFTWWLWCRVCQRTSVTNSFPHIVRRWK